MNWSIWAPGAFDMPPTSSGSTYGVTAELNQKQLGTARRAIS